MSTVEINSELGEKFIYKNLVWVPFITKSGLLNVKGPFCKNCSVKLTFKDANTLDENCWNCNLSYKKIETIDMTSLVPDAIEIWGSNRRALYPVTNFDIPPTSLSGSNSEDENFFIGHRFGQKDGRKQLHIWVGEKKKGQQEDKDKLQLVVDIGKKEVRYDQNNKYPGYLISEAFVTFRDSSTKIDYSEVKE